MKKLVCKLEIFVDKLIPYLLLLLVLVIIGEIFYNEFMLKYNTIVQILDWFIIFVFVIDLIFKYNRTKDIPKFFRASWIEIIAVFPFFLIFRLFEGFVELLGLVRLYLKLRR